MEGDRVRRFHMNDLLRNRKSLYLILTAIIISVFTLSIAYAILSVTLNITGAAEVVASNWDIHLENVKVKSGSVSSDVPVISGNNLSFSASLVTPGDYYEFGVDVVNSGNIDAMIDSVIKTPELTVEQAKYLKYEVSYASGESISSKQFLKSNSTTPIKVRLEYRNDLNASDLPSTTEELDLKITLIYVQADGNGSSVVNNGYAGNLWIASGNINTVGSEVCISDQCFYVIDNGGEKVTMLSKYNLHVGNVATNVASYTSYNSIDYKVSNLANVNNSAYVLPLSDPSAPGSGIRYNIIPLDSPTGLQNSNAKGMTAEFPYIGVERFSANFYWRITQSGSMPKLDPNYGTSYPAYIYDSNSSLYSYIENYKVYLKSMDVDILNARLIKYEELIKLGFSSINNNPPEWVYSSSYWTGSLNSLMIFYAVEYTGNLNSEVDVSSNEYGVRPVIEIPIDEF